MIREDFLLRLIRQVVLALVASRRQRDEARLEEARSTVDEAGLSLLGLPTATLAGLPEETIAALLSPEGELDLPRAAGAGMLLQERAAILDLQGHPAEADQARLRSVGLWLRIVAAAPTPATARQDSPVVVDGLLLADLSELAAQAPVDRLGLCQRRALAEVHAGAGQLDRAEDEIFALLALGDPQARDLGLRLFHQALAEGRGEPDELRAAISELQAR